MKFEKPKNFIKGFTINYAKSESISSDDLISIYSVVLFDEDSCMDITTVIELTKDKYDISDTINKLLHNIYVNINSNLIGLLYICLMKNAETDIPVFLKVAEKLNPIHGITGFLSYDEQDVFQ